MSHLRQHIIALVLKKQSALALLCCILTFLPKLSYAQPKYDISPFKGLIICATSFPTNYHNVGVFSLNESDKKGFDKNQTDDFILSLPSGFEFNPSASHSVTFPTNQNISAITLNSVSASQINITITTNGDNKLDTIYFNDFEIRATAYGNGDLVREDPGGGNFTVDGSNNKPSDTESFGVLIADVGMVVDSAVVSQTNTDSIRKGCIDNEILEIKISVSNNCPSLITQFDFNTLGTTAPTLNLSSAKVYFTENQQGFATNNLFGSFNAPITGPFTISGSQEFKNGPGYYYFYLAYDIMSTAIPANFVDATVTSFVMDGVAISSITNPNPAGNRAIKDDFCFWPDLPNPPPNLEIANTGSLIIPMDNANQSYVAGSIFNLKAYGLVHDLLMNDIPVKWVIRSGKTRNDTDFAALVRRTWPDTTSSINAEFRSSAFIVDSAYIDNNPNQYTKTARQVITDYGNNVEVFSLQEMKLVDVRYTLNRRPKIAVFNNGGNEQIHVDILNAGGVTNYVTVGAGVFAGINSCYTFCSEPHWAGTLSDSAITNNVKQFISEGGNFFGQCRGVDTYENYSVDHIVSTNGIFITNQTVSHQYSNPDLAFMQFNGDLAENEGGSERNWTLEAGSDWINGFYYGISHTDLDTIVASGAHIISPDSAGGNVFYMGGHDYAAFSDLEHINAARMYLNASLIPAGKPSDFPLDPGNTLSVCLGDSIQLGGLPTGPGGATYQWFPGPTLNDSTVSNPWATPIDTTTYAVIATHGGCIVGPKPITVNVKDAPISTAGNDTTLCGNVSGLPLNGSITNASGGVWTTSGSGTFDNDSLLAATYYPSIADTNIGFVYLQLTTTLDTAGCTDDSDSLLLSFTSTASSNAGTDQTLCSNNPIAPLSGSISNSISSFWVSAGTGSFADSSLLNTAYTASASDVSNGSVIITLYAVGNGTCPVTIDTMVIDFSPGPIVNAGPDTSVCANTLSIDFFGTVANSSGGVWSTNGSGVFSDTTTLNTTYSPSPGDLANGNVSLYLTSTGNGNCLAITDTLTLILIPNVTVDAGVDQVVCNNMDTIYLAGGIINGANIKWTCIPPCSGSFYPDDSTLTADYIISSSDSLAGSVHLILSSIGDTCQLSTDTISVAILVPPTVNTGLDQVICSDEDSVLLTGSATGINGSIWTCIPPCTGSFAPNNTSLTPNYLISTSDSLSGGVTLVLSSTGDTICPGSSDTLLVSILPPPTITPGSDQDVCTNVDTVHLAGAVTDATGGIWYCNPPCSGTFFPSDTLLSTAYIISSADSAAGSVVLNLVTTGACISLTDSILITVLPDPNVDFNFTEVCFGDSMAFSDASGSIPQNVHWDFDDGTVSTALSPPPHLFPASGSYNISYSVIAANGCADSVFKTITVHDIPVAAFTSDVQCIKDSANFTDLSTVSNDSITIWHWDFGDGESDSVQNPSHLFAAESSFTTTLIVSSSFGCTDTLAQVSNVSISPSADFTYSQSCFPSPVTFNDISTIDSSASSQIISWLWDLGDGNFDTTQAPLPHIFAASGNYIITLIVGADNGCIDTIMKALDLGQSPVADFYFDHICEFDTANFTDTSIIYGMDSVIMWNWNFGDGGIDTVQHPDHVYSNYGVYIVELIIETVNGCRDTVQQLMVISPNPTAAFIADNYFVSNEEIVNFTDGSSGSSIQPDTINITDWSWDFYYPAAGSMDSMSIIPNPAIQYADTGNYIVQLIVTNEYGCMDTIDHMIQVGLSPLVPSGFSPDGNGENDILFVEGGPYLNLEFLIYNEWGEPIFISKNQDKGWDGTHNGIPQPIGVYVYTIQVTTLNNVTHNLWGNVTLLR